jgi:hypothetical protein
MSASIAIRRLFLEPKPLYSIAEAAALLGIDVAGLRGWIDAGEIECEDGLRVSWAELVSFGLDFWSQQVVEEALGPDLTDAMPELLRLTDLEVRIPRLQVITLERIAARDDATVSAVLARELRDLISANSEHLSAEVPGFAEALYWPHP